MARIGTLQKIVCVIHDLKFLCHPYSGRGGAGGSPEEVLDKIQKFQQGKFRKEILGVNGRTIAALISLLPALYFKS